MQPIVLDISRSVSRASRGSPTGIDRVELAYIQQFIDWPDPVIFLARFRHQTALLNQDGMRELFSLLTGEGEWDQPDFLGYFRRKQHPKTVRVEATIRRLAISWPFLVRGLRKNFPSGFTYLNVGHGVLRPGFWSKLKKTNVGKIGLLVHDVIPLEHPEYCSEKTTSVFATEFHTAVSHADLLIFNSTDTQVKTMKWLQKWNIDDIENHVVLLGTDPLPILTNYVLPTNKYFLTLGTIEPRKNHRLLLDIWAEFHQTLPENEIPHLYIVGARGWMNEEVFHILDHADFMGKTVHEVGRIPDEELGSLMANANALLFPSFAEGFGYPLVEAMLSHTPIICSNLPSFIEVSGSYPTYIDPIKKHVWREQILRMTAKDRNMAKINCNPPNWSKHFHKMNTILNNI